jgi:hypothetical protein
MKSDPAIPVRRRSRLTQLVFAALLLILAMRAAWHASRAELGWELIRHDWGRTLAEWLQIDTPELFEQEPAEQAQFWRREIDRLKVESQSANAAAGAAWMLDSPQSGFLRHHLRANKTIQGIPGLPLGAQLEFDSVTIASAADRFENQCHARCTAMIEHATMTDPTNADFWRARALLLFRSDFLDVWLKPREHDWQPVLDECASHDIENAIYDYLGALAEWTSAADHRWEKEGYVLEVRDELGYERGNRRFAAGLQKPRLMFGSSGCLDTLSFLKKASLPRVDRLRAAEGCPVGARANRLMMSLLRWQVNQQSAQRRRGEFPEAAATLRDTLRVARQVSAADNPPGLLVEPLLLQRFTLANQAELARAAPELFEADEVRNLDARRHDVRVELAVLEKVGDRLKAKDRPPRDLRNAVVAALGVIAPPVAETVLLLALCFTILVRLCRSPREVGSARVGVPAHVVAWVAGLGLSYVIFGLCPVGIISAHTQTWIVRGVIAAPIVFALIGALIILNRKFGIGFSQLAALATTFSLLWSVFSYRTALPDFVIAILGSLAPWATLLLSAALLVASWLLLKSDMAFLRRVDVSRRSKIWFVFYVQVLAAFTVPWGPTIIEFVETNLEVKYWVPPRAWSEAQALGILPDDLTSGMAEHPWISSLLQWHAYGGPYIGLLLAVLLLAVLVRVHLSRSVPGGIRWLLRDGKITYMRCVAATVASSLAFVGMFAMVANLAAVPAVIERQEADYQRRLSRLVDPKAALQEFEAEIDAIRNDPAIMADLDQKADL